MDSVQTRPDVARDPFGMILNPADLEPWPPTDAAELAALDEWADECETEMAGRE